MSRFKKIEKCLGNAGNLFLYWLCASAGWRAFLFRLVVAYLLFKLGRIGYPLNQGRGGMKLELMSYGVVLYAAFSFIYGFTKAGKKFDARAEKDFNERKNKGESMVIIASVDTVSPVKPFSHNWPDKAFEF
jgi:hypothetical protein